METRVRILEAENMKLKIELQKLKEKIKGKSSPPWLVQGCLAEELNNEEAAETTSPTTLAESRRESFRPSPIHTDTSDIVWPVDEHNPIAAQRTAGGPFTISTDVLVADKSGYHMETLGDLIHCVYGTHVDSPYQEDNSWLLSLTTARTVFDINSNTQAKTPRRLLKQLEKANPSLALSQKVVNLIRKHYVGDEDFRSLTTIGKEYGSLLLDLCDAATSVMSKEPLFLSLSSPIYVLGDIHGSFRDLAFFLDNIVSFQNMSYTAAPLLFLGDYVDRGAAAVEVIALLLALKVLNPSAVFLLRGNHETIEQNGNEGYGEASFLHRCRMRFGPYLGPQVHAAFNVVFAQMPLAAEVDKRIFCTHGGIPRPVNGKSYKECLEMLHDPNFPRAQQWLVPTVIQEPYRFLALGLLWSDPAPASSRLDTLGFCPNSRGQGVYMFGTPALENFLNEFDYEYLIRAHEVKQQGLRLSNSGKVITVFTSSMYCGNDNGSGAVFISKGVIRFISLQVSALSEEDDDPECVFSSPTTAGKAPHAGRPQCPIS